MSEKQKGEQFGGFAAVRAGLRAGEGEVGSGGLRVANRSINGREQIDQPTQNCAGWAGQGGESRSRSPA
jgi:hypothetical protein